MPATELGHHGIPVDDIEVARELELAQAHRAQMQGLGIVLLEVVRTVHEAVVVDAVPDSEHVPDLVAHQQA